MRTRLLILMVSLFIPQLFGINRAGAELVGYWNFDEPAASRTSEALVGGINGTLIGNTQFTETGGIMGGAVEIIDGYVDMGDNFPSSSTFSIQAWVKVSAGVTSGMTPVSKHWTGIGQGYFLSINNVGDGYTQANTAGFYSANGAYQTAFGVSSVNDGFWHQLVGVYNNGETKIYVDGRLAGSGAAGFSDNGAHFILGGVFNGAPVNFFRGLIDEVKVYDNALTRYDIEQLYQDTKTRSIDLSDGLVAYYTFDGNANDMSGNGNHGTEYGGLTYKMGLIKEAASFDGVNDFIRVPYHASLNPVDQLSISFWLKVDGFTNTWSPIIHKGGPQLYRYANREYAVWLHNSSTFYLTSAGDGSSQAWYNTYQAGLDKWTNYTAIIDRKNHLVSVYVNGNLKTCANDPYSTFNNNFEDFLIGSCEESHFTYAPFKGRIDDLRLYDRALTIDEIYALTDSNSPGEKISVSSNCNFFIQEDTNKTIDVQLSNFDDQFHSITLQIVNPHPSPALSTTLTDTVTLAPGDFINVPITIDAASATIGVYDDILLKIIDENGEIRYTSINVSVFKPGTPDQPDLIIGSQDIQLTDYTLGDSVSLQAAVHNQGLSSASNVPVRFYEFGTLLGESILTEVPANGTETATITIPIGTSEGDHLIQVVVDPPDSIAELDETNNEASKIVAWGTPSVNAGHILVTGSSPSTVYAGDLFTVSGNVVYDVYVDGVRYTNYVVKGGSVQITIKDDHGNEWIYGGIHTDINGNFTKYLQAPTMLDTYRLSMTVTDKTFTGTRELVFQVVEKPVNPQPPPAPITFSGTGEWNHEPTSGTWTWTWMEPPVNEPVTQTDLHVFSEDIYFSKNNPDPNEDITFFVDIRYWATSTNLVAEDVPVNFYVTYPGTPREKIGSTLIPSLSVGSPDFGSRYVYGSWENQGQGIYIFEVEIDPSYTEENMLNNAATRAIIVGEIESYHGIIQGQVTNPWGGVEDVVIELHNAGMTTLIASTRTGTNGHYLFDSVPVGDYQVHIVTPDDYEADAETKQTEVFDQQISVVDFFLTKMESLCGDLDHDGDVDGDDSKILRGAFRTGVGDAGFIEEADYDEDGDIDYSDYQLWYYCYKEFIAR